MRLLAGNYVTNNSSLLIEVIKVSYQNEKYAKIKCNIINKTNGIIYETRVNYKVYKKNITHWKRTVR